MISKLKELLIQEPTEDGKPLFATATAFSKAIVTQKIGTYSSARSVNTLIGFVFRCERSCPNKLREAIIKATYIRLSKQSKQAQDIWTQRINRAIDLLNTEANKTRKTHSTRNEDQFKILLERAEVAEKHFIITPLTAEQEKGIKKAEELNQMLLNQLGIYPKNETLPTTQYWFLLPNYKIGKHFWEKLREKVHLALDQSKNSSWIDRRLRFLDKNNFLQVYIVPSYICGCPLVVYDPDHSRDTAGFSFSYHRNNEIDTIRWDGFSVHQWKENVFDRFKWQNPKTKKPFTSEAAALEFMKKNPKDFAGHRCSFHF